MRFLLLLILIFQFFLFGQDVKVKLTNPNYQDAKIATQNLGKRILKVSVTNNDGESIQNLGIKDFEVFEKETKAKVTKVTPLSESVEATIRVFLCLDNSTSMFTHTEKVLEILDRLVSLFPKKSNVDVVLFDESGERKLFQYKDATLPVYTKNFNGKNAKLKDYFRMEYKNLSSKTFLYDQIFTAFQIVNSEKTNPDELFIIVLSDGADVGSNVSQNDAINEYKRGKLFLVDFSLQGNTFLRRLGEEKNGLYFRATNTDELGKYFSEISDKIIFSGYEVTYESRVPSQIFLNSFSSMVNKKSVLVNKLKIEEVKSREIFPLLNYVFFSNNSSELAGKYVRLSPEEAGKFEVKNIVPSQMNVYYNVLNIIGARLNKNSEATITITGCNSDADLEKGNSSLSRERGENVRKYLADVFKIDNSRMTLAWRNLPPVPSNKRDSLGIEENRRVEITSNDPQILEVVEFFSNSLVADPEILYINTSAEIINEIKNWTFTVSQDGRVLYEQKGVNNFSSSIAWNVNSALAGKEITFSDFEFRVKAIDKFGVESVPNSFKLPINLVTQEKKKLEALGDKFIERVSLVLFEFNSSNIDTRNRNAILKLNESIKLTSSLIVKGYTDAIGSEEANLRLSQNRAKNVLESIKKLLKPETKFLSFTGIGKTAPLYDNNLPEGRFYNRTCQIVIETPISGS